MSKIYLLLLCMLLSLFAVAQNDTLSSVRLDEVVVNSTKETSPKQRPLSASLFSGAQLNTNQVSSVRELNGLIPNFFIPNYGSAMSTTSYIRGIGSRNSGQSMALYVDNVPYFEKSTFDFDFFDIRQLEVLRGSQGTLYGRNAENGIVSITTLSPLSYQGTKLSLSAGNYGYLNVKAGHYMKLSSNTGISASGYYNKDDGYFINKYTGNAADNSMSGGGRIKFDWTVSPRFIAQYSLNANYVAQGAFPYGAYNRTNNTVAQPNFNDTSSYSRMVLTNSLFLQYKTRAYVLSSTSSYQYFRDDMRMDLDYSTANKMELRQKQNQHALNEEVNIKSNTPGNYQWSFGATGFYQTINMDSPLSMKNYHLTIPGLFNTTNHGFAAFHQSTITNVLVSGLSLTGGIRMDYENVDLDYNTFINQVPSAKFKGEQSVSFKEFLPKISLKYAWNKNQYVYATASRGYKTGGFNVQMFSDLLTNAMMPGGANPSIRNTIMYQPEFSWNYELGGQCNAFNNRLKTSLALFYINVEKMQLAKIFSTTTGRVITNAGAVESKGIEMSIDANLGGGFSTVINYGLALATFTNYTDTIKSYNAMGQPTYTPVDYKGKYVPYAPQNTINVSAIYKHRFNNLFIDRLSTIIQYSGIGKIYWNEANTINQNLYSLINAKVIFSKGAFDLELWAKNILSTKYNVFYFYSGGDFGQAGRAIQCGATLKCTL